VSIDWRISCEPPLGEEPADPPQEDVVDYYTPEHGGYVVDVYLTEWVQFGSGRLPVAHLGNHSATRKVPPPDPTELTGFNYFETEHELQKSGHFPVPFDSYTFQVTAFAVNPATNQSVDIARFSFLDSPRGSLNGAEVTTWTLSTHNIDNGSEAVGNPRTLSVAIRYSNLTLTLTTGMFATTWVLTFASLYVTYSAVTKGMANWAIATLHSTMVLAITHIRNLYLCPPPFGRTIGAAGTSLRLTVYNLFSPRHCKFLLTDYCSRHMLRHSTLRPRHTDQREY